MHSINRIIDAFTDAHSESLQLSYDHGDSTWSTPPMVRGSDAAW